MLYWRIVFRKRGYNAVEARFLAAIALRYNAECKRDKYHFVRVGLEIFGH